MTDTEQRPPVHGIAGVRGAPGGDGDARHEPVKISSDVLPRRKQTDPTDPEVPDAKRRRAIRRRRSMLVTGSVVVGLVLIVLLLLYKIGRQVTASPAEARQGAATEPKAETSPPLARASTALPAPASTLAPPVTPVVPARAAASSESAVAAPNGAGHDAPRAKASGSDIFRKPAF